MRLALRVALVTTSCGVIFVGPSARAAPPGVSTFSLPCENGTVTLEGASVLWPPDHKFHPYAISYDGGAPGDVVTVSATSTDGAGVEQADPVSATVQPDATGASAAVGLFAERGKPGTGRAYIVSYSVTGSNTCNGGIFIVPPTDGRSVF